MLTFFPDNTAVRQCETVVIPMDKLRRDGETQSRALLSSEVVDEYTELLLEGFDPPPVRACFDGTSYWLTDGFHRFAAAERSGKVSIYVEVFLGSLSDAQWDSYRANASHGLRRTTDDLKLVVSRILCHEKATHVSNRELARLLQISEKTIRRFRAPSSSAANAADERIAVRKGQPYKINIRNIGKKSKVVRRPDTCDGEVYATLQRRLTANLLLMESRTSADVRRILNIFRNWTQRNPSPLTVLHALEVVVESLKDHSGGAT